MEDNNENNNEIKENNGKSIPRKEFVNPIDKSHTTDTPGFLPYAHERSGVVIKVEDKGKIKTKALNAMYQQTDVQMSQIYKQMETLVAQAKNLQSRKELSEKIYKATMGFEPYINEIYHVYQRKTGEYLLSLVAPAEWGKKIPFEKFLATVKMFADHTWQILEENEHFKEDFRDGEDEVIYEVRQEEEI